KLALGRMGIVFAVMASPPSVSTVRTTKRRSPAAACLSDGEGHHAFLEPRELPIENLLREAIGLDIVVLAHGAEAVRDADPRVLREDERELDRVLVTLGILREELVSARARGRDREEIGGDLDESRQKRLLPFELRLVDVHGVEERPREASRRTLDERDLGGEAAVDVHRRRER